jgi:hypothetical protein
MKCVEKTPSFLVLNMVTNIHAAELKIDNKDSFRTNKTYEKYMKN